MSDIKVGSVWVNRCDGVEAIVMSISNDLVDFSQVIDGQKYFYSHTVEEFKEYYEPKAKADDEAADFWKDGPGYCRQCKKSLTDKDIAYSDRLNPKMRLCSICLTYRRQERDLNADDLSDLSGVLGE